MLSVLGLGHSRFGANLRAITVAAECMQGGASITVDGEALDFGSKLSYRGVMFDGVPNVVNLTGYVNASWTLKIDLCGCCTSGRPFTQHDLCPVVSASPAPPCFCRDACACMGAAWQGLRLRVQIAAAHGAVRESA
jgi:hypothetical protein